MLCCHVFIFPYILPECLLSIGGIMGVFISDGQFCSLLLLNPTILVVWKNLDLIGLSCEITMLWPYGCYDYVFSKLHNDILPAHQPQNRWAQKNLVESVCAANIFAQLYWIKLLRVKKETKLTDECDRQLQHAFETLLLLTDCDFVEKRLVQWHVIWFMTLFLSVARTTNKILGAWQKNYFCHAPRIWCATLVTKTFCFAVRVRKMTFLGMTI